VRRSDWVISIAGGWSSDVVVPLHAELVTRSNLNDICRDWGVKGTVAGDGRGCYILDGAVGRRCSDTEEMALGDIVDVACVEEGVGVDTCRC